MKSKDDINVGTSNQTKLKSRWSVRGLKKVSWFTKRNKSELVSLPDIPASCEQEADVSISKQRSVTFTGGLTRAHNDKQSSAIEKTRSWMSYDSLNQLDLNSDKTELKHYKSLNLLPTDNLMLPYEDVTLAYSNLAMAENTTNLKKVSSSSTEFSNLNVLLFDNLTLPYEDVTLEYDNLKMANNTTTLEKLSKSLDSDDIDSFVPGVSNNLKADKLCQIAQEVHSHQTDKLFHLHSNKQYHSWPKQHVMKKTVLSYHNFGLKMHDINSNLLKNIISASQEKYPNTCKINNKFQSKIRSNTNNNAINEEQETFSTNANYVEKTDTFSPIANAIDYEEEEIIVKPNTSQRYSSLPSILNSNTNKSFICSASTKHLNALEVDNSVIDIQAGKKPSEFDQIYSSIFLDTHDSLFATDNEEVDFKYRSEKFDSDLIDNTKSKQKIKTGEELSLSHSDTDSKNNVVKRSSTSSYGDSDDDSGVGQQSDFNILYNYPTGIHPPLFKKRTDLMMQWFADFCDEQKNIYIQRILEACGLPQMHMLSLKLEPILHAKCPQNCQDMLQWLPENVVYHILQYLDPTSLSHASQVNRVWYHYAYNRHLWQRFCRDPDLQLSADRHREQIRNHTSMDGPIQWRNVFIERLSCKRNWKMGRCKVKTFIGHTQGVSCVQFDSSRIVSGSSDKTIRVWDLRSDSNESVLTLVGHSGTVRCLQLSENRLISGSADGTIKVWDLSVGSDWNMAACRVTMIGHHDTVRCLQVDEEKVISGSYDMTLKVWDLTSGRCKLTLRGHSAGVLCVQFDDQKIVSGSSDNTIKVWGLFSGVCLATLDGHQDAVTCLQFNHYSIISGSLDCTLKFWDLNSGQCIGTIDWIRSEGHTRVVRCLQADSWKIVSAGDDKTLKIWSLKTGERFVTLHKHTDGVTCLQFDDHIIVSGSYDKSVKVWDFSP